MKETRWQSYPRPQMKREGYKILNGIWKLNGQDIFVPFAPQSRLSGYNGKIEERLVYEMQFTIPEDFTKPGILLHFGAVDQEALIYVNDVFVGEHKGGYLPFYFHIEDVVNKNGKNILEVKVTDCLGTKYPYGKQCKKRGGMWYTEISGIWQTVWMENVPERYIESIKITPFLDRVELIVNSKSMQEDDLAEDREKVEKKTCGFTAVVSDAEGVVSEHYFDGNTGTIQVGNPINWTVENPYLYSIKIKTEEDEVDSYFALRTVSIQDVNGVQRVCLNNQPIFMHGVLDQGYFEDGIFLPEDEKEFERDILRMKELGFNMLRKHIKIEPEIFYYACDRLGMLVLQDMVNNGKYSYLFDTVLPTIGFKKKNDRRRPNRDVERKHIFEQHMTDTLQDLYNHPCIIGYTIFNEGWGQFDSDRMYDMAKELDDTRIYDSTSGWFAQKKSDFDSEHIYFRTKELHAKKRPMFLSECGGYTYLVEGHAYNPEKTYGYGACKNSEELTDRIVDMYKAMVLPGISGGVCGCVYTQLSDVEDEINGMYTYDREICKVNKEKMQFLSKNIYDQISSKS